MFSNSDEDDRKSPAASPKDAELEVVKEPLEKKPRLVLQDKKRSMKRKKEINHQKSWSEYCSFMNANLEKKPSYHESPLFVVRRSLHLIIENSIFLKAPTICNKNSLERKIRYEIDSVGKNVRMKKKNVKYTNIQINDMKGRKFFILVNLKFVQNFSSLVFFDELGRRMDVKTVKKEEKAYVLLAVVEKSDIADKNNIYISTNDLKLAERFWVNQIKTAGSFHFETSGKIFGIGFGPKYSIDKKTNLSIGQFGSKKKTVSESESYQQLMLQRKIFGFSRIAINHVFSTFRVAQSNLSPNISKLQIHFNLFDEHQTDQMFLQKNGILNAHLCLNAQTKMKHTECDSSYTTITVPPHDIETTNTGIYNKAEFEFNLTDDEAIIIPLDIGTTLIYSGFMLTHRQQIRKMNENMKPFVNIVLYNSQKMFNHLMESFRRDIKISNKK